MFCIVLVSTILHLVVGTEYYKVTYLCGNNECTEPISSGKSLKVFNRGSSEQIHLKAGDEVEILGKSTQATQFYVKNKRSGEIGYVPTRFVEEGRAHQVSTTEVERNLPKQFVAKNIKISSSVPAKTVAESNITPGKPVQEKPDDGNHNESSSTSSVFDAEELDRGSTESYSEDEEDNDTSGIEKWFDNDFKEEEEEIVKVLNHDIPKKQQRVTNNGSEINNMSNVAIDQNSKEGKTKPKLEETVPSTGSTSLTDDALSENETDSSISSPNNDSNIETVSNTAKPTAQDTHVDNSDVTGNASIQSHSSELMNSSTSSPSNDSNIETASDTTNPNAQETPVENSDITRNASAQSSSSELMNSSASSPSNDSNIETASNTAEPTVQDTPVKNSDITGTASVPSPSLESTDSSTSLSNSDSNMETVSNATEPPAQNTPVNNSNVPGNASVQSSSSETTNSSTSFSDNDSNPEIATNTTKSIAQDAPLTNSDITGELENSSVKSSTDGLKSIASPKTKNISDPEKLQSKDHHSPVTTETEIEPSKTDSGKQHSEDLSATKAALKSSQRIQTEAEKTENKSVDEITTTEPPRKQDTSSSPSETSSDGNVSAAHLLGPPLNASESNATESTNYGVESTRLTELKNISSPEKLLSTEHPSPGAISETDVKSLSSPPFVPTDTGNKSVTSDAENPNEQITNSSAPDSANAGEVSEILSLESENNTVESTRNPTDPIESVESKTAHHPVKPPAAEHPLRTESQTLHSSISAVDTQVQDDSTNSSIDSNSTTDSHPSIPSSPELASSNSMEPDTVKPQGFKYSQEKSADRIQPEMNLSNERAKKAFNHQVPDTSPPADEPSFEGTAELQHTLYDSKPTDNFYDIIRQPDKQKGVIPPSAPAEEKAFYDTMLEYVPDMLSIFQNFDQLSSEVVSKFWPWKNEDETKGFCSAEQNCDGVIVSPMKDVDIGLSSAIIYIPGWGEVTSAEKEWLMTYVGVLSLSAFVATIFLFIFNSAQNKKRANALIALVNRLENKLLVATKEIVSLEDQLTIAKPQQMVQSVNTEKERAIKEAFKKQVLQFQQRNTELEDKVTYLEKELESVSTYALEMHKLFENSLTTQTNSKAAIDEVEELRCLTEKQENEIEEVRREMDSILIENQCLKEDNNTVKTSLKKLEKEYNLLIKKNLELSEKQRDLTLRLDKEMENNATMENNYKSEIYQLHSKLEDLEMNLKTSEFQVEELNRAFAEKQEGTPEEVLMCDQVKINVQLKTLEKMNNELTAQLKEEKGARRMLEEHMRGVMKDLNNTKKSFQVMEKERNDAVTKLQVLQDHFKEKEAQLRKDLEEKEKQFAENENKDQLLSQKLASMKEEINNYKLQNEALKKEIKDQEGSYKSQLANAEQKREEHWFAFRETERKYKACQQEAASLRNRILTLERNLSSLNQTADDKGNGVVNGNLPTTVPLMMYPPMSPDLLPYPVPGDFIPPPPSPIASHSPEFFPPEPLYSPDGRLPPLGGLWAPSPSTSMLEDDDEFAPPPPDIKYLPSRSRNEPPVPSSFVKTPPPSNRHRFKNRQQRNSMDSPSSGVSLESLDKSGR